MPGRDRGSGLGDFADEIGKALRRARTARGLTLREVSAISEGRFKATSVAGYERGERTISMERFCDLCDVYEVSPPAMLGDIVRVVAGNTEPKIDLTRLEGMGNVERTLVAGFVRQILAQRHGSASETIVLREADVDVLATAAGKTREELVEALEPGIRRAGERPN
jgi:transcriptional regulator with XRE-family HTH domain